MQNHNLLLELRQRLVENLHEPPDLLIRIIQRHRRYSNHIRLPLIDCDPRILQHIHECVQTAWFQEDTQLSASRLRIRWGDDFESVTWARKEKKFEVCSKVDGFLPDVCHGGLVEDRK
jgi:hypothetical protein